VVNIIIVPIVIYIGMTVVNLDRITLGDTHMDNVEFDTGRDLTVAEITDLLERPGVNREVIENFLEDAHRTTSAAQAYVSLMNNAKKFNWNNQTLHAGMDAIKLSFTK
jgi:hypothetical protein